MVEKFRKNDLIAELDKIIKGTRIRNKRKGRYTFEANKIFEKIRKFSKMTKAEAEKAQAALNPETSNLDLIYSKLLETRINGKNNTSVEMYEQLIEDMKYLTFVAEKEKIEEEIYKTEKQKDLSDEDYDLIE